jgi:hypothetical protein
MSASITYKSARPNGRSADGGTHSAVPGTGQINRTWGPTSDLYCVAANGNAQVMRPWGAVGASRATLREALDQ